MQERGSRDKIDYKCYNDDLYDEYHLKERYYYTSSKNKCEVTFWDTVGDLRFYQNTFSCLRRSNITIIMYYLTIKQEKQEQSKMAKSIQFILNIDHKLEKYFKDKINCILVGMTQHNEFDLTSTSYTNNQAQYEQLHQKQLEMLNENTKTFTFIDPSITNSNNDCKPFIIETTIKQEHGRLPQRLISMESPGHSYGESIIDELPPLSSSTISTNGCLNRCCCGCIVRALGSSSVNASDLETKLSNEVMTHVEVKQSSMGRDEAPRFSIQIVDQSKKHGKRAGSRGAASGSGAGGMELVMSLDPTTVSAVSETRGSGNENDSTGDETQESGHGSSRSIGSPEVLMPSYDDFGRSLSPRERIMSRTGVDTYFEISHFEKLLIEIGSYGEDNRNSTLAKGRAKRKIKWFNGFLVRQSGTDIRGKTINDDGDDNNNETTMASVPTDSFETNLDNNNNSHHEMVRNDENSEDLELYWGLRITETIRPWESFGRTFKMCGIFIACLICILFSPIVSVVQTVVFWLYSDTNQMFCNSFVTFIIQSMDVKISHSIVFYDFLYILFKSNHPDPHLRYCTLNCLILCCVCMRFSEKGTPHKKRVAHFFEKKKQIKQQIMYVC